MANLTEEQRRYLEAKQVIIDYERKHNYPVKHSPKNV